MGGDSRRNQLAISARRLGPLLVLICGSLSLAVWVLVIEEPPTTTTPPAGGSRSIAADPLQSLHGQKAATVKGISLPPEAPVSYEAARFRESSAPSRTAGDAPSSAAGHADPAARHGEGETGHSQRAAAAPVEGERLYCTDEEAAQVAEWLSHHSIDNSKCPGDSWLEALRDTDPSPSDKLLINVGVNKGYNFVRWLSLWRPDLRICPRDWNRAQGSEDCGACRDCQADCHLDRKKVDSSPAAASPLVLVGVDPVSGSLDMIRNASHALGLDRDAGVELHLLHAGCGAVRGKAYPPECPPGEEGCMIIVLEGAEDEEEEQIEVYPVDGLWDVPDLQGLLQRRGTSRPIDILHIDTEGHDSDVLRGANQTLQDPGVRLLSFEYNDQGPWAYNTLKASVDGLDAIGYDCYFQGQGRVFRLTGCWHPKLELWEWSNVLCTRRVDPFRDVLEKSFRATAAQLSN